MNRIAHFVSLVHHPGSKIGLVLISQSTSRAVCGLLVFIPTHQLGISPPTKGALIRNVPGLNDVKRESILFRINVLLCSTIAYLPPAKLSDHKILLLCPPAIKELFHIILLFVHQILAEFCQFI
ncbi:MAG: hypothetical protein WCL02_04630 [bacterium]